MSLVDGRTGPSHLPPLGLSHNRNEGGNSLATPAKPRILFLTATPPLPTMGGSVTFYRQFVERDDYSVFVVSDKECQIESIPWLQIELPSYVERMKRTRIGRWVHDYINLFYGHHVPTSVLNAAKEFHPDLIYTVPGTWLARMARSLARKVNVPLAAHFMDWGTYNVIGHEWAKRRIDRQFRQFYQDCDLAFCICEGMRDELGPHPNAPIHYPLGAPLVGKPHPSDDDAGLPLTVAFAGNLGEWYGTMLRDLATTLTSSDPLQLKIYGNQHNWSSEVENELRVRGIYRGFMPFENLQYKLEEADILLLIMGFTEESALTERTSFKTKWVDYLSLHKPVVIWGPPYCSAVRMAQNYDAAECCTSPSPEALISTITRLSRDAQRHGDLVRNARRMWQERLNPEHTRQQALNHFCDLANLESRDGIR